jgi:hypothetical protein
VSSPESTRFEIVVQPAEIDPDELEIKLAIVWGEDVQCGECNIDMRPGDLIGLRLLTRAPVETHLVTCIPCAKRRLEANLTPAERAAIGRVPS